MKKHHTLNGLISLLLSNQSENYLKNYSCNLWRNVRSRDTCGIQRVLSFSLHLLDILWQYVQPCCSCSILWHLVLWYSLQPYVQFLDSCNTWDHLICLRMFFGVCLVCRCCRFFEVCLVFLVFQQCSLWPYVHFLDSCSILVRFEFWVLNKGDEIPLSLFLSALG